MINPNLFNKLGPYEFMFLDKKKKTTAKYNSIFNERYVKTKNGKSMIKSICGVCERKGRARLSRLDRKKVFG